jgi:hypothetical protein
MMRLVRAQRQRRLRRPWPGAQPEPECWRRMRRLLEAAAEGQQCVLEPA